MKTCSILFFLLLSFNLNAQINFEKGYYLDNQQKRFDGFIKNYDWKNNPTEFEFKTNLEDTQTQIHNIGEISEFGIDQVSTYKRFIVNIEKSSNNTNSLTTESEPIWNKETLFLKVISSGKAILYQYKDGNISKYFYQIKNQPVEQLVMIKYIDNENQEIKSNNYFKRQLYTNVNCGDMDMAYFDKITFAKNDLIKHFERFNSCSGDIVKLAEKTTKGAFHLKAALGGYMSSLSIKDLNSFKNLGTNIDSKLVLSIGAEAEYILPFNKNKWSLFIQPNYQSYSASKSYTKPDLISSLNPTVTFDTDIKYSFIELPIGLRHYMFLNDHSKLFLNAMISLNFTTSGNMVFYRDRTKIDDLDISAPSGYAVGFGYNYKNKISLELRYNLARNLLANYNEWKANYSSYGLLASYYIF